MKRTLLILLLLVGMTQAEARIRLKCYEHGLTYSRLTIKNVAGFAYDYSNFQLVINGVTYNLSSLADMNLDIDESVSFELTGISESASFSCAIFYPGVDVNGTPGVGDLVDFMQNYHSMPYEALAANAGLWTAGQYVQKDQSMVLPEYWHYGGAFDEGASYWVGYFCGQFVGVDEIYERSVSIYPNPTVSEFTIDLPVSDGTFDLQVFDLMGKAVMMRPQLSGRQTVSIEGISKGSYVLRLSQNGEELKTIMLVKTE